MPGRRIVVAMSGGVDSSVAALLLARGGWDVTGLFMRTGTHAEGRPGSCCSLNDCEDARRVADRLGVPFYAVNFEAEFRPIIDYFVREYGRGRTPNPCVLCNRDLKFGRLYEYAAGIGADFVATGHYAAIGKECGRFAVRRGRDPGKDQSYVLFVLNQRQLARTVLPLGDLRKDEVRRLAREAGLSVSEKAESQEICFVPESGTARFLADRGAGTPGPLVDETGREVGRHGGFEFFTVGQRRGLGIALGEPRYVTGIDAGSNTVRIGPREQLFAREIFATGWVGGALPVPDRERGYRALVQIRYRHRPARAWVRGADDERVRIVFEEAQSAICPGQAVVAYRGDCVAGGGWIERVR